MLFKTQINTILAYSAKKKNTKILAECSVIKPLTSSDSKIIISYNPNFMGGINLELL